MKLKNDFYKVTSYNSETEAFETNIELDPTHIIYAGHFPGKPVTPGVIQLQIVHELLEGHFGKNIRLVTVRDCKFLKILIPREQQQIRIFIKYNLDNSHLNVSAEGTIDTEIFFKLRANYKFE